MLSIFLTLLGIGLFYLFVIFIMNVIDDFKRKSYKNFSFLRKALIFIRSVFDSFIELIYEFTSPKILVYFGLVIGVFIVFSFMPYLNNLNDTAYIFEQEKNIELYHRYIEEYSESARKQIEEFQEMQSEMAARATSEQLQFWSLQQDDIGDALTEQIRDFNVKIRDAELEINHRKGRIEARNSNKWYFFMED